MNTLAQAGLGIDSSGLAIGLVLLLGDAAFVPMILLSMWWTWQHTHARRPGSLFPFLVVILAGVHIVTNLLFAPEWTGMVWVMMVISAVIALIVIAVQCRIYFTSFRLRKCPNTTPVVRFLGRSVCQVRSEERCIEMEYDNTSNGYIVYPSTARHQGETGERRPVSDDDLSAALRAIRCDCDSIGFTLEVL